jgi:3-dehydroquinate dehydratase/shikimate dehydrogenase
MICVSLGRTRHSMMIAEHQALAEKGAQLVELRLDWLSKTPELNRLIDKRPTPVVITCRRPQDGGRAKMTEDQRQTILRQAIVAGVDYVDLEFDIATKIRRYGKTKRIISFHDFNATPDTLEERYAYMCSLDPDIVKIVTMAQKPEDNIRLLQLIKGARVPTVAFCMGEFGLVSRVLCGKFGAPFTYATFSQDRVLAPGQLSFDEMKNLYRYDQINADTKVFGVLGDPIAHSYSPRIHNAAFKSDGINAVYLPMRVPAELLDDTLKAYSWLDVQGYSVTIPHKERAMMLANFRDDIVEDIGAANTLFRDNRNNWYAANTDFDAALSSIKMGLEMKGDHDLAGKRVLLLGAGGVAKAIGQGVLRAGGALTITNRTKQRGQELAEHLGCQFVAWENRGAAYVDVLVNCTPIGMYPNMNDTPFQEHWLREGTVVFDTIYNPEQTLLIKQAKERGCITVSGLEMFVAQAAAQYHCFTRQAAPVDVMREALRKGISAVRG